MPLEARSRITLLLPAPITLAEFLLLDAVLTDLIQVCGGVTVTSLMPSVLDGWWMDYPGHTVRDANVLILADANVPPEDGGLGSYLDRLKARCQHDFNQDIVWVTIHRVDRVSTDDYVR